MNSAFARSSVLCWSLMQSSPTIIVSLFGSCRARCPTPFIMWIHPVSITSVCSCVKRKVSVDSSRPKTMQAISAALLLLVAPTLGSMSRLLLIA